MSLAYDGDFPDPFVLRVGDRWHAYATGGPRDGRALRALVSDDFVTWRESPDPLLLPRPDARDVWAPEVAAGDDGRFYLYTSYATAAEPMRHNLIAAVADDPLGPFTTVEPLVDAARTPFAIDAHPFRDEDGTWWLFYARDFPDHGGDGRVHAGTALVADRLVTMTKPAGEPKTVLRARHDWTLFEKNRDMPQYGGRFDWHTLEGPCVRKVGGAGGRYCLMFSGGRWENESYGVDYAWGDRVDGPYAGESPTGPRVLGTKLTGLDGPGHHSLTTGPDGRDHIVFHAWDAGRRCRQMHVRPLAWTDDGPRAG